MRCAAAARVSPAPATFSAPSHIRRVRPSFRATVTAAAVGLAALLAPAAAMAVTVPAATTPGISAAGTAQLITAYAAYEHIPAADIAGIRPGSVHAATVDGVGWATASFLPAAAAAASVQDRFQDGIHRRLHQPGTRALDDEERGR
jgi:hypothetical protein